MRNTNRDAHFKRLLDAWAQSGGMVDGFLTADQLNQVLEADELKAREA